MGIKHETQISSISLTIQALFHLQGFLIYLKVVLWVMNLHQKDSGEDILDVFELKKI